MDFWTSVPYWGILALVALNAWLVIRRDVRVEEREGEGPEH